MVAGDLVSRGPLDAECVDRIRGLDATVIAGNTGLNVVASDDQWAAGVRADLGPSRVDYLANLPLDYRTTPTGGRSPDDACSSFTRHRPIRGRHLFLKTRSPGIRGRRRPRQPTSSETRARISSWPANVHYAQAGLVGTQRFETIASVSSACDGHPRAGYALAAWDGTTWQLNDRRASYDVEAVAVEIERTHRLKAERWAHQLRTAIVDELYVL